MPAQQFTGFGTPFQRIILQELQDVGNSWLPVMGGDRILLSALFNRTFTLDFTGPNVGQDASGNPVGNVTGIKISMQTPVGPLDIVNITGLNIADLGQFVTGAQVLSQGEPDFSDPNVASFFNAVTPDVIKGSDSHEFFESGTNPVTINTGKGNDVMIAGPGGGTIKMGAGKLDALDFRNLSASVNADLTGGTATSGTAAWVISGTEVLGGSEFGDMLIGSGVHNLIFGAGGDDVIRGLGDDDTLFGQLGADRIFGGAGDDFLRGGLNSDKLHGGSGADVVNGDTGDDRLFGNGGNDKLQGGNGKDRLNGGGGNDDLAGQKGHDSLKGASGNDILKGGSGNDRIEGGKGDDILSGDAGKDVFVFAGNTLGADSITDFVRGEDQIHLHGQTAVDVTVTQQSTNNYLITHAQGTIEVFDASDAFTIADIGFL